MKLSKRKIAKLSRAELWDVVDGLILDEIRRTPRALYTIGCLNVASRIAVVLAIVWFAAWVWALVQ